MSSEHEIRLIFLSKNVLRKQKNKILHEMIIFDNHIFSGQLEFSPLSVPLDARPAQLLQLVRALIKDEREQGDQGYFFLLFSKTFLEYAFLGISHILHSDLCVRFVTVHIFESVDFGLLSFDLISFELYLR